MGSFQVTGVRLSKPQGTHEDITHIGYLPLGQSSRMIVTLKEALERIEVNPKEFYIIDIKGVAYLQPLKVAGGSANLTTHSSKGKDQLLRLQRC
jgi:hypothetical protein